MKIFRKKALSEEEWYIVKYIHLTRFNRMLIFQLVTLMHLIWGVCLLVDPIFNNHTTELDSIFGVIPSHKIVGILLLFSSACASTAMYKKFKNGFWRAFLLIPQQFFLTLTAIAAIMAISYGEKMGGHIHSHIYMMITRDDLILIALFHTYSLLYNFVFVPFKFRK